VPSAFSDPVQSFVNLMKRFVCLSLRQLRAELVAHRLRDERTDRRRTPPGPPRAHVVARVPFASDRIVVVAIQPARERAHAPTPGWASGPGATEKAVSPRQLGPDECLV
jgi:hypothetical protein